MGNLQQTAWSGIANWCDGSGPIPESMKLAFYAFARFFGLVTIVICSLTSARAVELLENSTFDTTVAPWQVAPELRPWSPLTGSSAISMHPAAFSYNGDIITQNLNVTGVGGVTVLVAFDIQKNSAPPGRTVQVFLEYVDNVNSKHRVKVMDVDNDTVAAAPASTPASGSVVLPADARKLTRIALVKQGFGEFVVDNIHATATGVTVNAVPVITGVAGSGLYGTTVTVSGTGFGAAQGSFSIGGGTGVAVQTWTNTQITATIQEPARSGTVLVISDFTEANGIFDFSITSPNFTIDMFDTEQSVLKGAVATYSLKVGFHNGFTSTNGVNFFVPEAASAATFSPSPVFGSGGVLLSIDTSGFSPGTHVLTVQTLEDNSFARFAQIKLTVGVPASAKFFVNGAEVTSLNRSVQGEVSPFGFQLYDAGANALPTTGVVLSSTNPSAVLAVPRTTNGINRVFIQDDGTANIRITAPDGFTADLPVTVALPASPKVIGVGVLPSPAPNSNAVDVTFNALATGSVSVGCEGGLPNALANGDWNVDNTAYTAVFRVPVGQKPAVHMFYGGTGGNVRHFPFEVVNDPATGAVVGEIRSLVRGGHPDVSGTVEFYTTISGDTPVFTRSIFEFLSTSYIAPSVPPGSYKIRFVPGMGNRPTWYPGASSHAGATPVTVAAGQTVQNIHFFVESGDLSISQQPNGTTVNAGGNAQFSVVAQGGVPPYSYQWRKNGGNLSNGPGIAGADSANLTLSGVPFADNGAEIDVIVSDSGIASVTSQAVALNVINVVQNGVLAFSSAAVEVGEAAGNVLLTITRTNGTTGAVSVRCQTSSGSATAGGDFTAVDQVVNFASGETSRQVSIPILNDTAKEEDEQFTVTLGSVTGGASLGATAVCTVTIADNDDTKAPTVVISKPAAGARISTPPVMLSGTAKDDFLVAEVLYRVGTGTWMTATGTDSWSAELFNLVPGANTVEVKAIDAAGKESAIVSRTFTFVVLGNLQVSVNGNGKVSPGFLGGSERELGKTYAITAIPAPGQVFDGWNGTVNSGEAKLQFQMVAGMNLTANFIPNPFMAVKGTYSGLFSATPPTRTNSGGVKIAVSPGGTFSAKFDFTDKNYTLTGQFDNDGAFTGDIIRRNQTPLRVSLQLDVTGGSNVIEGTISDGTFAADIIADRSVFNSRTNPAPQAGKYTLIIRPDDSHTGSPTSPQGQGFGTVNVTTSGRITFVGTLGDGTDITQGSTLATDGTWPLYLEMYKAKGYITSEIVFEDLVDSDLNGKAYWLKPQQTTGAVYRAGFEESVSFLGSRYNAPRNARVLSFSAATILVDGGNLTAQISKAADVSTQNKVTIIDAAADNLKMTIKPATGQFSGSFVHPVTRAVRKFEGVCVQKFDRGGGLFIDADKTGQIVFVED